MDLLPFEKLDAYKVGLDFAVSVHLLADELKSGRKHIADQLRRASCSVIANTGEGAGEAAKPEKARFYRMALRSATECTCLLTLSHRLGNIGTDRYMDVRSLNIRVYALLTRLAMVNEAAEQETRRQ